jgi:aspartyl-tRNA(Asn)/glutamyl-tRNA(Gln) amidotransferase subunit A
VELHSRPLRIGWLTNAWKSVQPGIAKLVDAAARVLKKTSSSVKNATLPVGPWEEAAGIVVAGEAAASFRALIRSGRVSELTDPLGQLAGYVNQQYSAADYLQALKIRGILQKKMEEMFDSFDVLVAASQPLPATALDLNLETGLNFADPLGGIGNLCGLPAISVPCGFTENNLPAGLQFVARAGDDIAVIQAARTFQLHTDWHKRHPKIH